MATVRRPDHRSRRTGRRWACAAWIALSLGLIAIGSLATVPASAQTETSPEDVAAIARTLNCPLCQGYNLQDCPLEVCAQMRSLIREQLEAGRTRDEIVAGFVADYGPQVLNAPPSTGFFAVAWVAPVVALLIAAALAWGILRRRAPLQLTARHAAIDVDAEYVARLERMAEEDR